MGGLAHVAEDPHLRVFPDGAGVENQKIGPALVVREAKAHVGEHSSDELCVGLVLLAAKGNGTGQRLPPEFCMIDLPDLLGIFLLCRQQFRRDNTFVLAHIASKKAIKIHIEL